MHMCLSYLQIMLFVLFEHSVGYCLFEVTEFEEIGSFIPQVEQSVTDFSRFNKVVKLSAFIPFNTAADALEAINSMAEGSLQFVNFYFDYYL